jgi:hypothetical protein
MGNNMEPQGNLEPSFFGGGIIIYLSIYLFKPQMGFLPGASGTTIRHTHKNNIQLTK